MSFFIAILRRDLLLAVCLRSDVIQPVLFFTVIVAIFPLGVGPEKSLLTAIAPGVIWVAALLATLLSLDSIFRTDFEDGSLEQVLLSGHSLWVFVLAKITIHWLTTGLPLVLIAPLLAVLLGLSGDIIGILLTTLLLGTPILSIIGAIGVALTIALKRGGILLSLLVLPLYIPVLIFGTTAIEMVATGWSANAQLGMLASLLALCLTLGPWPTSAAIKLNMG